MARRMSRSEIQGATNQQLNEQIEIRQNDLDRDTAAMEKTEKEAKMHEAEVNNVKAKIIQLQELKAQMQQQLLQQQQPGHGQ